MLCARVLRTHHPGEKQNVVLRAFEWMFNVWLKGYEWSLDKVLRYKPITLLVTLGTMAGSAWLYITIPKGFFPGEDTGIVIVRIEGPADISFRAMRERQNAIAEIIRKDPAVAYVNSTTGVGGPNATVNIGSMFVGLKPKAERGPSGPVLQRLRRTTASVVAWWPLSRDPEHQSRRAHLEGRVPVHDAVERDRELYKSSDEMLERIKAIPGLRDINSDLYVKNPEVEIEIDREKAAFYGITPDQIRQELYNAFGNRQVATIYTPINDYQVILETRPDFQADTTGLSKIYLKTNLANTGGGGGAPTPMGGGVMGTGTPNGMSIPLSAVTSLKNKVGPLQVNHQGQQPAVTISFNLDPGTSSAGGRRDPADQRDSNIPLSITPASRATRRCSRIAKGQGILVLAAVLRLVVSASCMRASSTRSPSSPACRGRRRRAAGADA